MYLYRASFRKFAIVISPMRTKSLEAPLYLTPEEHNYSGGQDKRWSTAINHTSIFQYRAAVLTELKAECPTCILAISVSRDTRRKRYSEDVNIL